MLPYHISNELSGASKKTRLLSRIAAEKPGKEMRRWRKETNGERTKFTSEDPLPWHVWLMRTNVRIFYGAVLLSHTVLLSALSSLLLSLAQYMNHRGLLKAPICTSYDNRKLRMLPSVY